MAKGLSLHIGLNFVNSKHYRDNKGDPWNGKLGGCENDARSMQKLANSQGFESTILLRDKATCQQIINKIRSAAQKLQKGDIFFLSYSGHGGQTWDISGDEPANEAASPAIMESGGKDETFCFYDRQFLDDEMNKALGNFKAGVRVLVLSDCCHSGTNTRVISAESDHDELPAVKQIPFDASLKTTKFNRALYVAEWNDTLKTRSKPKSTILLISGCQDSQLSRDGTTNGAFTAALLKAWNEGHFKGNYRQLQQATAKYIRKDYHQTPNYFIDGATDKIFEQQQPFTI